MSCFDPKDVYVRPYTRTRFGKTEFVTDHWDDIARTLAFLKLLTDHELSGGVTAEEVQRALGASHPKGVGSKIHPVNNLLKAAGFDPEAVYTNTQRDPLTNGRIWKAGHRLKEALEHFDFP